MSSRKEEKERLRLEREAAEAAAAREARKRLILGYVVAGLISVAEAQPAASAFREIADANGDGRITPYEYARAREFILARY